jgi:hypothetical protein
MKRLAARTIRIGKENTEILKKYCAKVLIGFIWLKIVVSGSSV